MNPSPPSRIPSLCFGTVQLGQAYGLANPGLAPSGEDAFALLDAAWAGGVRRLDTARAYGLAEERIGAWIAARGAAPSVVTKFPPVAGDDGPAAVAASLEASLAALGLARVDGLLAHRAADLALPGVAGNLRAAVDAGGIGAFGASVYGPGELDACLGIDGFGLVQLPLSLADRRALSRLPELARAGVRVHARSAFLQGALLMAPEALPRHLDALRGPVAGLRALAREGATTPLALALDYVLAQEGLESVVFGAYTHAQLAECLAAGAGGPMDPALRGKAADLFEGLPEAVVDPSFWPR